MYILREKYYKQWITLAQAARAAEYTDWIPAKGRDPHQLVSWYDIKESDGDVPVMQELCAMRRTSSLQLLSGSLKPKVAANDKVLSMAQIVLNCVLMFNWNVLNRTVLDIETAYLC